jgi:ribonuclease P protein component
MTHTEKGVSSKGKSQEQKRTCIAGRNAFSKASRILKRTEFLRLSKKNRKVSNRHFVAIFDRGVEGKTRLGVTVSKRVGNAVVRNQLKRYVREYFRQHRQRIANGIDVNIIAKKEASGIPSKEAYLSLQSIFSRIRD